MKIGDVPYPDSVIKASVDKALAAGRKVPTKHTAEFGDFIDWNRYKSGFKDFKPNAEAMSAGKLADNISVDELSRWKADGLTPEIADGGEIWTGTT